MVSAFVREQKRYSQEDLCGIFQCNEENAIPLIRKLKEFGILKAVKASDIQKNMSDLLPEDIEVADVEIGENDYFYVFTFVGIVVISGRVLKCYPKYLSRVNHLKEKFHQVIKVLEKYNSKKQIVQMFNDSIETKSFNLLAVLLFLIHDYYEFGSYTNTEDVIESNGSGEIFWDKTINETFMLLSHNRPYYIDILTKKRIEDEHDYFKRLHECVLTKASKELKDADLLDIFEITEVDLSDEDLSDFGEKDYILNRIEKELNVQFNTRKQNVLKTIYAYIHHSGSLSDIDTLALFGSNSFNLVWEDVCAEILDDKRYSPLCSLELPVPLKERYNSKDALIDLIDKPFWSITSLQANATLRPDIITIKKIGQEYQFIIFDAKYYVPILKNGVAPKGQPGIESITKQYLYQLAYKEFIEDHGFADVKNCFLMPTENQFVIDYKEVSLNMLSCLELQDIKVRCVPAEFAYNLYLTGKTVDIEMLFL